VLRPIVPSCLHQGNPLRHQTRVNSTSSRRHTWRAGRANGKGFTIITNAVIDLSNLPPSEYKLLSKMMRFAHNVTGEVTAEVAFFAREMGWTDRWTRVVKGRLVLKGFLGEDQDYDPIRRLNRPNTYRILNPHKSVETTAQSFSTPPEVKFTQVLQETLSSQTQEPPPTPLRGEPVRVLQQSEEQEPKRPAPSAEVWESEQLGRRMRHERKAERRQDHYREVRERGPRRRCSASPAVLTPLQRAAVEVMRLCGVVDTSWRIKAAIEAAIALRVEQSGVNPLNCVEQAVMSWWNYQDDPQLRFRVGMERFFAEGLWVDTNLWTYDRELRYRY